MMPPTSVRVDQQKRQEWVAAVDKMESLRPRVVIAGHKRVGSDDSPRMLVETRKYAEIYTRFRAPCHADDHGAEAI
jgi:hypothetical protein